MIYVIVFTANNYLIYKTKQSNGNKSVHDFYLVAADSWFKTTVLN